MSKVFVLDTNKQPLDPVHSGRARLLLKAGKAAVYRRFPFTLILKRAVAHPTLHPLRFKIDAGDITDIVYLDQVKTPGVRKEYVEVSKKEEKAARETTTAADR